MVVYGVPVITEGGSVGPNIHLSSYKYKCYGVLKSFKIREDE